MNGAIAWENVCVRKKKKKKKEQTAVDWPDFVLLIISNRNGKLRFFFSFFTYLYEVKSIKIKLFSMVYELVWSSDERQQKRETSNNTQIGSELKRIEWDRNAASN